MPQGGHQVNAQIWRHDETQLLIERVNQLGKQWKAIGKLFGRSSASVRGRWKRVAEEEGGGLKTTLCGRNICKMCGKKKLGHICKPLVISSTNRTGQEMSSWFDGEMYAEEALLAWVSLSATCENDAQLRVQEAERVVYALSSSSRTPNGENSL